MKHTPTTPNTSTSTRFGPLNCSAINSDAIPTDWHLTFTEELGNDPRGTIALPFYMMDDGELIDCVKQFDEAQAEELRQTQCAEKTLEAALDCYAYSDEFEPSMDFAYPLGNWTGDENELAADLYRARLPLIVVTIDGQAHLALTGTGKDFSWEIAEAYLTAGMRPPLWVSELPKLAERGESERDRAIMAECIESNKIAADWAKAQAARLTERLAALEAHA